MRLINDETAWILTAYGEDGDRFLAQTCDRVFTIETSVVMKRQVRMVRNPANSWASLTVGTMRP